MGHRLNGFLSAAAALMLTACGGGGESDVTNQALADPVSLQSMRDLASDCNADISTIPAVGPSLAQPNTSEIVAGGARFATAALVAVNGYVPFDDHPWPIALPMADRRGMSSGYYVDLGTMDPLQRMGLQIPTEFPSAGIMCLRTLSGVTGQAGKLRTVLWRSQQDTSVDLSALPAPAIDGFEWLANFMPPPSRVVFTVAKSQVLSTSASICYRPPTVGSTWICQIAQTTDSGLHWAFSAPATKLGLYALVAKKPA